MIRFTGRVSDLSATERRALLDRSTVASNVSVREATARILERVRLRGDQALGELARELDGVAL